MKAKTEIVVTLDNGSEIRQWHTVLVGARADEESHHGRSETYKRIDELDRLVCASPAPERVELRMDKLTATVIRDYLDDTVEWLNENAYADPHHEKRAQEYTLWSERVTFALEDKDK